MIAIMPIIMAIIENVLLKGVLISHPINTAVIPKKSKLKPTIIDTNSEENIGKIIKSKPTMIDNIPAFLLIIHFHLPKLKLILYMMSNII